MRNETKLASIVVGWVASVVVLLALGVLVDPLFAAFALGSVATLPIMYFATKIGGKMIVQNVSSRTDEMLDELQAMNDEINE
jgi:hypothetical protein